MLEDAQHVVVGPSVRISPLRWPIVSSLSIPYLQGNGLGAFALVVLPGLGPLGRQH